MLDDLLQPSGPGIFVALGLVGVYGIFGSLALWTKNAALPRLRSWPSWSALVYVVLTWIIAFTIAAQFFIPDMVPWLARASFTDGAARNAEVVALVTFCLGLYVLLYNKDTMLGLRNCAVVCGMAICSLNAATVLRDRAFVYELHAAGIANGVNLNWNSETYRDFLAAAGLMMVIAALLTVRCWQRDATRLRYVESQPLGIFPSNSGGLPPIGNLQLLDKHSDWQWPEQRHPSRWEWLWAYLRYWAVLLPVFPCFPPDDPPPQQKNPTE